MLTRRDFLASSMVMIPSIKLDSSFYDHVDVIEHNYFYDDIAQFVFAQFIFYDWNNIKRQYLVRSWLLDKWNFVRDTEEFRKSSRWDQDHYDKWCREYRELCDKTQLYKWENKSTKYYKFDPLYPKFPQKNFNGKWIIVLDIEGRRVIIESTGFIETHTQFDPERLNRKILPENQRVPLKGWNYERTNTGRN